MDADTLFTCKVNTVPIQFAPDTGSQLVILDQSKFRHYCAKSKVRPKLTPVTRKVYAANRTLMKFAGKFTANLASEHAAMTTEVYVLSMFLPDPPLLSEQVLLTLGYIKYDKKGGFAKPPGGSPEPSMARKVVEEDLDDISEEEMRRQIDLLHKKYSKVFTGVGRFKRHKAHLQLKKEATPFTIKAASCPINLRKQAQERLQYFVDLGIYEPLPANYPLKYCSPMLYLKKPNKDELRLVISYVTLNSKLYRNREVPAIGLEEFSRVCCGHAWFFRLDLKHAYLQLEMDEESQDLCVFSTFMGCFKPKTLQMGIRNAGDCFDAAMENTLINCTNSTSMRDDIIGGGATRRAMILEYEKVLQALEDAGVTCDISKTEVGTQELQFYGMKFNKYGFSPCPSKVAALRNAPRPTTHKALNSFICMVAWNSTFLHRFSEMVKPLRDLVKSKAEYVWLPVHEAAFRKLQEALCEDCLNHYFREDRKTVLFSDAGKTSHTDNTVPGGFSAILAQVDPDTNQYVVIHYASRAISDVESRYGQPELEAKSISWAVAKFRWYLTGIHFTIFTDAKCLLPLFSKMPTNCPPRIFRCILAIQDMDYTMEWIDGSRMPCDWGSRNPIQDDSDLKDMELSDALDHQLIQHVNFVGVDQSAKELTPIALDIIRTDTKTHLTFLMERIQRGDWLKHKKNPLIRPYLGVRSELSIIDGIIFRGPDIIVLPETLYNQAVKLVHRMAHSGMTNSEQLLKSYFYFPGYSNYISAEVQTCEECQHVVRSYRKEPLGISPIPTRPFEVVACDFKGVLYDGRYALIFLDLYSRYPECYFCSSTSMRAVRKSFLRYFAQWGYPRILKSDSGPPFSSKEFERFMSLRGIKHQPIIVESPQSNESETFMKLVGKTIELTRLTHGNLDENMMTMLMIKRSTPHPSLGNLSPHQAVTGWKLNPGLVSGKMPQDPSVGLTPQQQIQLQKDLLASKVDTKIRHDNQRNVHALELRIGDIVLVRLGQNKLPEKQKFQVIKVYGKEITAIGLDTGRVVRRHVNRFTLLKSKDVGLRDDAHEPIEHVEQADPQVDAPAVARDDDEEDDLLDLQDREANVLPNVPAPPQPGQNHGIQQQLQPQQPQQLLQPPPGQDNDRRQVGFNPNVDVRVVDRHIPPPSRQLRSSGVPAPDLPNVMRTPLENSAQARAEATAIIHDHEQTMRQQLDDID